MPGPWRQKQQERTPAARHTDLLSAADAPANRLHPRACASIGKHLMVAADGHRARGVACPLGKLRRGFGAERPDPVGRRAHNIALDFSARRAPQPQRLGIIAKGNTNILKNPVNLGVQLFQRSLIKHIKMWQLALNIRRRWSTGGRLVLHAPCF